MLSVQLVINQEHPFKTFGPPIYARWMMKTTSKCCFKDLSLSTAAGVISKEKPFSPHL